MSFRIERTSQTRFGVDKVEIWRPGGARVKYCNVEGCKASRSLEILEEQFASQSAIRFCVFLWKLVESHADAFKRSAAQFATE